MERSRFIDSQIISILKEQEQGRKVADICRDNGISQRTYHKWKSKYRGMEPSHLKWLKELGEENRKLKRMYADVSIQRDALNDVIERKEPTFIKKIT